MKKQFPAAFLSYAHKDDKYGHVTKFCERLGDEIQMAVGTEFNIFQDYKSIQWGQNWRRLIEKSIDEVTFLIPIITPRFFNSEHCRAELQRFLERETRLNRDDLVLPVYFIDAPVLNDEELRAADELAQAVASRQYADWRELRFEPFTNPQVGRTLERLARQIRDALPRAPAPAPPARKRDADAPSRESSGQKTEPASPKSEPPTCTVNPMPRRGDFTTIGEAIERSDPGARIVVQPGFYQEGLIIDKPLEIIGVGGPGDVVVQVSGKDVILFQANMGRVTNLTLRQAGGGDWFAVDIAQGRLELEDCDITSQGLACVAIHIGADPRLRRNRIRDGREGGVRIYNDGLGTLEDNDIFGNSLAGVEIKTRGNPTLRRNRIHDGKQMGVFVYESGLGLFEDNDIFGNAYSGVVVQEEGRPTLRNNRIYKNGSRAIRIHDGGGGTFEGNDLRGNFKGAWNVDPDCEVNVKRADNQE